MSKIITLADRYAVAFTTDSEEKARAALQAEVERMDEAIRVALDALIRAQTHLLMPADCEAAIAKLLEVRG